MQLTSYSGIYHDISLAMMIDDANVIIFEELLPSMLYAVQILLCEHVLQALVVGEELEGL